MATLPNARRKGTLQRLIERIGLKDSVSTVKFDGRSEEQVLDIENHTLAVKILLDDLIRFNIINLMMRLLVLDTVSLQVVSTSKSLL